MSDIARLSEVVGELEALRVGQAFGADSRADLAERVREVYRSQELPLEEDLLEQALSRCEAKQMATSAPSSPKPGCLQQGKEVARWLLCSTEGVLACGVLATVLMGAVFTVQAVRDSQQAEKVALEAQIKAQQNSQVAYRFSLPSELCYRAAEKMSYGAKSIHINGAEIDLSRHPRQINGAIHAACELQETDQVTYRGAGS